MDIGWKVISAGAGVFSGFLANKLADGIWKVAVGRDHPQEDDYTEPLRDAIVFSVVSAAVAAVVNQLVMRQASKWYGLDKVAEGAQSVADEVADATN
ncbi:DUF4235 domain-containing protein [Ancrocorticia populi]|uniref:DUF4235 domain-containing protein n=1 Tax=Ancrocorticia populi TaxID=2175228 RepID=A0A2V1K8Z9_9ACTO|nr:DUF4235 domain-containing protein [Ancrocorticia populi]PWF26158.1 hypothetical protein DD236_08775 [Ancrocorticia populi]